MHLKKGNNDKQSFDKPNINWKAFQNIGPGAVYSSLSLKNWWFGTVLWLETPWCVFLLQARLGSWCGSGWDGRTAAAGEVISWGLQSLAETPSRRAILRFKLSSTALLQRKLDLWLSGSSGFVTRESKNWRRWGCGGGTPVERFFFSLVLLPHGPALTVHVPVTVLVQQNWRLSKDAVHSLSTT